MATRDEMFKSFDEGFANIPQQNTAPVPSEAEWNAYLQSIGYANAPGTQAQEAPGYAGGLLQGALAQGLGVIGNQAEAVASWTGNETAGQVADAMADYTKKYARPKEYEAKDILTLDYWKDPYGASYDIGGGFGSTVAMAAEAALLAKALAAAGITGAATLGAGALSAVARKLGLSSIEAALATPAGQKMIGNLMLQIPVEAFSESGGTGGTMTHDQETGERLSDDQIDRNAVREAMTKDFVGNVGVLGASKLVEGVGVGRLLGGAAKGFRGKLKKGAEFLLTNGVQNAWEEGAQSGADLYARGEAQNISQIYNPLEWTPEQLTEAAIGGVAGIGQGGAMSGGAYALNRVLGKQQQQAPEQQAQENTPATETPTAETAGQPVQATRIEPKFTNAVTNEQFGDAVNVAMNDQSASLVDRMRNLQGHITYDAKDGTNCARTAGLALAGTDYQDLINVDDFVATAKKNGQYIEDTENYVPQPGDLAVVNDGNHIVMVTENGGVIQNGSSANGVYESKLTPQQMFGKVDAYIRTSDYSAGQQQAQAQQQEQQAQEAEAVENGKGAIRDVLDKKSAEQRAQQEALAQQQGQNVVEEEQGEAPAQQPLKYVKRWQDAFTEEEIAGLDEKQRKSLKNKLYRFKNDNPSRTVQETHAAMRDFYNKMLGITPQQGQQNAQQKQNPQQNEAKQEAQVNAPAPAVEEATVMDSSIPAQAQAITAKAETGKGETQNGEQTKLQGQTGEQSGNQNLNTQPEQIKQQESQVGQSPESAENNQTVNETKAQRNARLVKLANRPAKRIVNKFRNRVAGLPKTRFDSASAIEEAKRKAKLQAEEAKRVVGAAVRTNQATAQEAQEANATIDAAVANAEKNIGKTRKERIANSSAGKTVAVRTDDGTKFKVRYKVVSADDIVTSNMADGSFAKNPEYPQRLQPRNRQSAVSQATANKIAAELDPELLTENPLANLGAPIIDQDGNVENGNLRMIGIMLAHAKETDGVKAYEQHLAENAERFGLTRADVEGVSRPVLVRERIEDADGLLEKIIGTTAGGQSLNATEQAKQDAKALTEATVNKINVKANGDLNQEFIAAAIQDIAKLSPNVENMMRDANGNVSQNGLTRIKNALFAKAYGSDPRLLQLVAESTDNDIKSITSAMLNVAPKVVKINALMDSGRLLKADFTKPIIESAETTDHMRKTGKSLERILQEGPGMFENMEGDMLPLSQGAKDMLGQLSGSKGSVTGITRVFGDYLRSVEQQNNNETNIIGAEEVKTTNPDELVKHWIEGTKGTDIFAVTAEQAEQKATEIVEKIDENDISEDAILADGQKLIDPKAKEWIKAHPFKYDTNKTREENANAARKAKADFIETTKIEDTLLDNSDERKALRVKIKKHLYNVGIEKRKRERKATIVIGLPAAGKSTVSKSLIDEQGYLLVDSDEAKKLLPEFADGLLAGIVHEESSYINGTLLVDAIAKGDNICLPVVGGNLESLKKKIQMLHDAKDENGNKAPYEVTLAYVDIPADEAVKRVMKRFEDEGRFVEPNNILANVLKEPEGNVIITIPGGERKGEKVTIPIDNKILKNYLAIKAEKGIEHYEWINNNFPFKDETHPRGYAIDDKLYERGSLREEARGRTGNDNSEFTKENGNGTELLERTTGQDQVNRADTENQGGSSISADKPAFFGNDNRSNDDLWLAFAKKNGVKVGEKTAPVKGVDFKPSVKMSKKCENTWKNLVKYLKPVAEGKAGTTEAASGMYNLLYAACRSGLRYEDLIKIQNEINRVADALASSTDAEQAARSDNFRALGNVVGSVKIKLSFGEISGVAPAIINKNAVSNKTDAKTVKETLTPEKDLIMGVDVSEQHEADLEKRLKKVLTRFSANPMFDPELWSVGCQLGAIKFMKGARTVGQWAKSMVEAVGDTIKPWLGALWKTLTSFRGKNLDSAVMTDAFEVVGKIRARNPEITADELYRQLVDVVGDENQVKKFKPYIKAAFDGISELVTPTEVTAEVNNALQGEKGVNNGYANERAGQGNSQPTERERLPENSASENAGRTNTANDRSTAETAESVDNQSDQGAAEVRNEAEPGRAGGDSEQLAGTASENVQTADERGAAVDNSGNVVSPVGGESERAGSGVQGEESRPATIPTRTEQPGQNGTPVSRERNGRAGERGRGTVSEDGTYEILPNGDYHIIDAGQNEIGGTKAKDIFKQNMLAFETLKRIQDGEDVEFTPETMNALARYTGWGRFRNQLFGGEYDKMQPQEGWEQEAQMVHDAMTKEEWENVRDSTDTAFYTPYSVTTAMWNLAKQLGLKHGNILEPSMGVGGFFATMPKEIFENSTLTGIEIEPTSGEIAKNLYPSAHVFVQGYEDFVKPNNSYDFIVSNVPYANISMADTEEAKRFSNPKSILIHDFFFLRGINQLRPGGVMMALTSTGTMDKQDSQVRIALAQKAELVGAIRLPNKTFKESGGTDVSCDLLVFRKRETPISYLEATKEPWINTTIIEESKAGKTVKVNEYFANNEQNVIGTAEVGVGKFGPTLNVRFNGTAEDIADVLNERIKENFPSNIMGKTLTKQESEYKSADISHPNHTFYMKDGELMYRSYDEEVNLAKSGAIKSNLKMPKSLDKIGSKTFYQKFIAKHPEFKQLAIPDGKGKWEEKVKQLEKQYPDLAKTAIEAAYEEAKEQDIAAKEKELHDTVAPLIQLNEKYQELLNAETQNESDEVVEKLRKEALDLFNKAVDANGGQLAWKTKTKSGKPKTNYANAVNVIRKAGDYNAAWNIVALQSWDKDGNPKPADILLKRMLRGVIKNENPTIKDSLKMQIENGADEIDIQRIEKETNKTKDEVLTQLIKDNAVYETPEGTVVPTNIYLSGDVRSKLKQAQVAAQKDDRFKRNVDALMKVQPEQVTSSEITAIIGANWVSPESYKEFFASMFGLKPNTEAISVENDSGKWRVTIDPMIDDSTNWREKYGDRRKPLSEVIEAAMNKGHLKVFDIIKKKYVFNEDATRALEGKVKEINELFNDWLWNQNDERREAMERKYNDEMNNTINPVYNAEFIDNYPGLVKELKGAPFYPKTHQKNVVLKFLTELRGIAAHDAGTGKTLEIAMLCMQLRQTGKAKKPIIFAHNANSASIVRDFKKYYPGAKVLYVQNVSKSENANETSIMLSQMTSGDWDAIVLPHSLIDRVAFDEKTALALRQEEIDYYSKKALNEANQAGIRLTNANLSIEEDHDNDFDDKGNYKPSKEEVAFYRDNGASSVLDYIKRVKKIRRECHILGQRLTKPGYIDFAKTGIDACLIDEAHEFKKGPKATTRQVRGLDTGTSDMGQQMDILTRYIHSIRDNKGVFEFTGTLLTNTIPEIHTHMRYVMPDVLKRAGIYHLDDFLGTFTEAVSELEPTETGDYESVERLRRFVNIVDLRNIAGQHIDIVTTADMPDFAPRKTKSGKGINDKTLTASERDYLENGRDEAVRPAGLPNKKVINVVVPNTKRMDYIATQLKAIAKSFKEAKGADKKVMAVAGVPLKLMTLAPMLGASIRNLHKNLQDLNTSKAKLCAKNIKQIYDDAEKRGVVASQVIFMEKGYSDTKSASQAEIAESKGGKFYRSYSDKFTLSSYNMAKDLKAQIAATGIPEEKIAIVGGDNNPYKDPTARAELCEKVKSGEIAVIIAQYGTMGVGANLQDNLRAVHHIDAPWMPGELEQENRRAVRQGNHWNTVLEYRYITQGVDSKKWSALAAKISFINAFMDKHSKVRVIESDALGEDSENAGDILQSLAGALGDDRVVQLENKKKKKEQLQKQRRSFENRRKESRDKAKVLREKTIPELQSKIKNVDVDMSTYAYDREMNPDFSVQVRNPLSGEFITYTDREQAQKYIDNIISNRIPAEYENDMIRFRGFKVGVQRTWDITGHEVGKYFVARSMKPTAQKQEKLLTEDKGEKKATEEKKQAKPKKDYIDVSKLPDDKFGKATYIPKQTTINSLQATLSNLSNTKEKWLQELPQKEELLNTYENQGKAEWKEQQSLDNINKQITDIEQDLKDNPIPAPEWFRDRIKVGSIVEHNGNEYVVVGYSAPDGENYKDYGIMVENPVVGEEKRMRIPASEIVYNNEKPYTDEELALDPRQRIEDASDEENFTPEFESLVSRTLRSYFGEQDWGKLLDIHGIERKYVGQSNSRAWTKEVAEVDDLLEVTYTPPEAPETFEGQASMEQIHQIQQKIQASVAENTEPRIKQSVDQLVDDIKSAFPTAKEVRRNGQHLMFIMPNGSSIAVDIANQVFLSGEDAENARKAHGKNADEPIRVNGYSMTFGKDAAIKLAQDSDRGTAFHEAWHPAYNIVLNAKEKAAVQKEYGNTAKERGMDVEEVAADAYRDWQLARKQRKGTRLGKLFQKIQDFAYKALSVLTGVENVHNVMRKVAEGEVWNREGNRNKGTKTDYLVTNPHLTADTKLPVLDFRKFTPLNPNDPNERLALQQALVKRFANGRFTLLNSPGIEAGIERINNPDLDATIRVPKRDPKTNQVTHEVLRWPDGRPKLKPAKTVNGLLHWIFGNRNKPFDKMLRTAPERLQATANDKTLEKLLSGAVYVDVHRDAAHGRPENWAALFAAIRGNNGKVYRYRIMAKVLKQGSNMYEIKSIGLYDFMRQFGGANNSNEIAPSLIEKDGTITAAKLLKGVFDRQGRDYVDKKGNLVYDPNVKAKAQQIAQAKAQAEAEAKAKEEASEEQKPKVQASISSVADKGLQKAKDYVNRNQRTANENTAEGRVGSVFKNTANKDTAQSAVSWLEEQRKNFYRDFVDKNDAFHEIDDAIEATTGKKLASDSKLYNAVQIMKALQNGAMTTLIEGDKYAMDALRERIGDTVDTENNPEAADRIAELKKRFKSVSMADVMKVIEYKKMDEAHPDYLAEHGLNSWREAFSNYLGARRLVELARLAEQEGIDYKLPKNVSLEDFKNVIRNAPKEFGEAAEKFYQLQNNVLVLMEDGNLIGKEIHDYMRETYHDYCPLMVDFSDTAAFDKVLSRFGNEGNSIANVNNMLKYVLEEGSERGLISPLESTYKNIAMLTDRAERNKVASKFVQMVENDETLKDSGILVKVDGKSDNPKECIFTVLRNGEKVAYKTTQALYGPLMTGNEQTTGLAFSLMRGTARTLRAGATTSPSFILRNLIRDTIFATVSSRNGFIPLVDSWRGFKALRGNDKMRGEFEAMGVSAFNFYGSVEQSVKSLDQLAGGKLEIHSAGDLIKALFHYAGVASELVEASTRMGEYLKARESGKSMQEAALDAKEVTLDFSRSGRVGQKYNQIIPFFNAAIQGGDKMARLLSNPETRWHTAQMLAKYIMLPSLLLWIMNKDEPWYEELDPAIKMSNWILPGGIRIPKPQEAGIIFGSGIEALMDRVTDRDPVAMKNWVRTTKEALLPNVIPTLFLPLMEWQANYSFFREKALEGKRLQKLPVELRFNNSTTELNKAIGSATGLSPVKLDNTVRGYLGTMGMLAWQIPDLFVGDKRSQPAKRLNEMFVARDFLLNDMNMNRTSEDFYDLVTAVQQKHAGYGKKGKPSAVTAAVNKANRDVSAQNKEIQNIIANNSLDSERKRQMIDKKKAVIHQIQKATLKKYGKYLES